MYLFKRVHRWKISVCISFLGCTRIVLIYYSYTELHKQSLNISQIYSNDPF